MEGDYPELHGRRRRSVQDQIDNIESDVGYHAEKLEELENAQRGLGTALMQLAGSVAHIRTSFVAWAALLISVATCWRIS